MRYIKTYKIFEAFQSNILQTLEDICDELRDNGFNVEFSMGGANHDSSPIGVSVDIREPVFPGVSIDTDYTLKLFPYSDIKSVFDRMIEYMKSEGWECVELQKYGPSLMDLIGDRWSTFDGYKYAGKCKSYRIIFRKK